MIHLGLINNIKEYFLSFNILDLIPFFTGLIAGFIICLLVYLLVVISSLKKTEKNAKKVIIDVPDEDINRIISNTKNRFSDEAGNLKTTEKLNLLKDCCWDLLNDISRAYYPNSKHPLFELSIEEIINLDYYIMERIEKIFDKKIIKKLKTLKITSVLNLIDKTKKITENKAVKAAKKAQIPTIAKGITTALNLLNPVYWVKKVMINAPYQMLLNKIAYVIIEVVGEETSKVYSKRAFVVEDETNIDDEINQLIGDEANE